MLPRVPAVFESEGEASFGRVDDVSDLGETKLDANSARMRELGFEGVGGVEQQNSIMDKLRDKGLNAEAASTIFHAFEQVGTKQIVGSLSPSTSLQSGRCQFVGLGPASQWACWSDGRTVCGCTSPSCTSFVPPHHGQQRPHAAWHINYLGTSTAGSAPGTAWKLSAAGAAGC